MSKREDELLLQKYISPLSFIHFIFSAIYGGMAVEEK